MTDTNTEPINSLCDKCHKKGFRWARGSCQYCGHKQYDDNLFVEERDIRDAMKDKAADELKKVRETPERQFVGAAGDGSGGCGGDC